MIFKYMFNFVLCCLLFHSQIGNYFFCYKGEAKIFFSYIHTQHKTSGFFLLLFTVSKSRILHRSHLKVLVLHNSNSVHIGLYVTLALSSVPQTYSLLMTIKSTCSSCSHGPICKSEGFFVFKHRLAWNIELILYIMVHHGIDYYLISSYRKKE